MTDERAEICVKILHVLTKWNLVNLTAFEHARLELEFSWFSMSEPGWEDE
jgi:hypothetical protein